MQILGAEPADLRPLFVALQLIKRYGFLAELTVLFHFSFD
jgi:hypothetical protein